jgi:protein-disulfide isomerase
MSKKKSPNLPPPHTGAGESKNQSRAAVAAQVKEQQRKARRRNALIQAAVGAVVVLLVIVGTVAFLANRDSGSDRSAAAAMPPRLTDDGAVRFGAVDAPVTVQIVEDFQCPVCRQFETIAGELLARYRDSDDVAVEYRPIAFLDQMSSTEYSSRALNASMCVLADADKSAWHQYAENLFEQQPPEGGSGLHDDELVSLGEDAGASGDALTACVEDRRYDDWAEDITQRIFDAGVTGTPTVFVNGEKLDSFDPAVIESAVNAALEQ